MGLGLLGFCRTFHRTRGWGLRRGYGCNIRREFLVFIQCMGNGDIFSAGSWRVTCLNFATRTVREQRQCVPLGNLGSNRAISGVRHSALAERARSRDCVFRVWNSRLVMRLPVQRHRAHGDVESPRRSSARIRRIAVFVSQLCIFRAHCIFSRSRSTPGPFHLKSALR